VESKQQFRGSVTTSGAIAVKGRFTVMSVLYFSISQLVTVVTSSIDFAVYIYLYIKWMMYKDIYSMLISWTGGWAYNTEILDINGLV
jgi:hypothetical protein